MSLMEGTLADLCRDITDRHTKFNVVSHASFDVLKALDFIACAGFVHRDLKPANILYDVEPNGERRYVVADFGQCNIARDAVRANVGTNRFEAPGFGKRRQNMRQTAKADIWSLFVSMLWLLDENTKGRR